MFGNGNNAPSEDLLKKIIEQVKEDPIDSIPEDLFNPGEVGNAFKDFLERKGKGHMCRTVDEVLEYPNTPEGIAERQAKERAMKERVEKAKSEQRKYEEEEFMDVKERYEDILARSDHDDEILMKRDKSNYDREQAKIKEEERYEIALSQHKVSNDELYDLIIEKWEGKQEDLDALMNDPKFEVMKVWYADVLRDIIMNTGISYDRIVLPRILPGIENMVDQDDLDFVQHTAEEFKSHTRICAENIAPVFNLEQKVGQRVSDLSDSALSELFGDDADWLNEPTKIDLKEGPKVKKSAEELVELSKVAKEEHEDTVLREMSKNEQLDYVDYVTMSEEEKKELAVFNALINKKETQIIYARIEGLPYTYDDGSLDALKEMQDMELHEVEEIIDSPEGLEMRGIVTEELLQHQADIEKARNASKEVQDERLERELNRMEKTGEIDSIGKDPVAKDESKVDPIGKEESSNSKVYDSFVGGRKNKVHKSTRDELRGSRAREGRGSNSSTNDWRSSKKESTTARKETGSRFQRGGSNRRTGNASRSGRYTTERFSLSEYLESDYYNDLSPEEQRNALFARFTGSAQEMAYTNVPGWDDDVEEVEEERERIEKFETNPFKRTIEKMKLFMKTKKFRITMKVGALMALNLATGIITKQVEFESIGQILTLLGISLSTFYLSRELSEEGINEGVMAY